MRLDVAVIVAGLALSGGAPAQEQGKDQATDQAKVDKLVKAANEVMKEVEELRGRKFKKDVKKGVQTAAELREFIEKKLFDEELPPEKLRRQQLLLQLLGLIPKDMDLKKTIMDVLLSQIGGFYDPSREAFFMMARAAEMGEAMNRMMIAHELTHALDDQYYKLDPMMKACQDEHDASFAVGAVIEGSATALMQRWAIQFGMKKYDMMSQMRQAMKTEAEKAKVLLAAPPYFATLIARYMAGSHFLTKGKGPGALARLENGVDANAEKAFGKLPLSSEQILHPAKYWNENKLDLPVRIANDDAFVAKLAEVVAGRLLERETYGEIHMALLTRSSERKLNMAAMNNASYWTNKAARGWGGDRAYLFAQGEAHGVVWVTLWDTEEDAEQFEKAHTRHYASQIAAHARAGRAAVFVYGFTKPPSAKAVLKLVEQHAELVKGGQTFALK